MTIEKLKELEPIFGSWYVDSKIAEGRNSKVFRLYKTDEGVKTFLALKAAKFPSSDRELSRVIESGKYSNIDEYLDKLEIAVSDNMKKMLSLRTNPNIVRYDNFKIIRESSCFYVIMLMELLTPFSEYVKAESVTTEDVIKIGNDLCFAAEGFRNAGIMHHQIKPENIYIDENGDFKLGDFGISNVADRIRTEASPYMAPEVYQHSNFDTNSDIYSIGVLLYKLMNNNRLPFLPPYPAPVALNDREAAFEMQMRGDPLLAPACADGEMTKIIFRALAYKQEDRYFNPLLMRTELERYTDYIHSLPTAFYTQPLHTLNVYSQAATYAPDDENDIKLSSETKYREPRITVSEAKKAVFRKTFKEDAEEDDNEPEEPDDNSDNKKMYLLIAAIIAVSGIIIALLFFIFFSKEPKKENISTTADTTVSTTQATTAPTTALVFTTTEPSTTETTTQITTEATTESTTQATTAETTSAPQTTAAPTTQAFTGTPDLIVSTYEDGADTGDGRKYTAIEDYTLVQTPENEFFDEVIIDITTPLGTNLRSDADVYVYEMSGQTVIQKHTAKFSFIESTEDGAPLITCFINIEDGDFYYSPEIYEYYVCFEAGAIESDSAVSLPLQIEV